MDDDTKKPARGPQARGPRREGGDARPFRKSTDGAKKPFRKAADGAKKPFAKAEDGARKPFRKSAEGGGKPFVKREEGDRRPFQKSAGERKPFRKAEDGGARPFRKREDGDSKPFRRAEDRDRKPYRGGADGERKPFRKSEDGERKPFRKREDGDAKPFRKAEDGDRKPYRGGSDGERKPFRKREDGDRKPFGKSADGDRKPFRPRADSEHKPSARRADADQQALRPGRREREEATTTGEPGEPERIARRLARAGVASRRDAEAMIAAGRISLNGKVLDTPAVNVTAQDRIEIDGKPIPAVERTRLFLFHKPAGVVTTNKDPEGRQTVFDVLPPKLPRLMTIGRLDINTEGLLLLTNDGGLSRVLELPATGWLRRYRVRVHGKVDATALAGLKDGIAVDGVFYGAVEATLDREQGSNAWLSVGLREGKNREVKNILGALGLDVTRLIRLSYGPFQLGELAEGEVKEIKGRLLRDQLGERLIAESGANFDAPVLNEFTNKPVSVRTAAPAESSGPRPNRKREREEKREDALGRLQTARPKSFAKTGPHKGGAKDGKARKDGGGREERPSEPQRSRTANVWMAPGARPLGEKKKAALAERSEGRRYAGKPRPAGPAKDGRKPGGPGKGPRGGR